MYEDLTQNYDPEIHDNYLIYHTPILLPHRVSHVQIIAYL